MLRVAIHTHTHYSHDSNVTPRELVEYARNRGFDRVAVTDHDEVDGALEAARIDPELIIVGEEISSREGHILGLFLTERIPPGLPARETIAAIHDQGGVAFAAHPFVVLCDNSLGGATHDLVDLLDGVEGFNAQNPLWWQDRRAQRFANDHNLPMLVGMDAHVRPWPNTWQEMPEFTDAATFVAALRAAKFVRGRAGFRYAALMCFRHAWDLVMPRRLPGFGVRCRVPLRGKPESAPPAVVDHARIE